MAQSPIIGYGASGQPRRFMWLTLTQWLVVIGISALLVSIILPMLARMRECVGQLPCPSHLRQIGQAIQLYAMDNAGQYPPDLPTVLRTQNFSADGFICPNSPDRPAEGDTPQQQAAQLLQGHCSYIYVGRGFTTRTNPDCVVGFEDPANHDLEGSTVLFADGHVEFLMLGGVVTYISEFEQGYNPPRQNDLSLQQARAAYQRDWVPRLQSIKSGQWSLFLPATRPAKMPSTQGWQS
jgi:prepilin-type processing-associated H-X9-DG protein